MSHRSEKLCMLGRELELLKRDGDYTKNEPSVAVQVHQVQEAFPGLQGWPLVPALDS